MEKYLKFRQLLLGIGKEKLGSLCEKFLYDHEGAIQSSWNIASASNMKINLQEVKDFITAMHEKGDFDDVNCFSTPLIENELYKKFHPDKLSTSWK